MASFRVSADEHIGNLIVTRGIVQVAAARPSDTSLAMRSLTMAARLRSTKRELALRLGLAHHPGRLSTLAHLRRLIFSLFRIAASRSSAASRVERWAQRETDAHGGAIQREASVLPGRGLTQSRQTLQVAPDRSRIGLVLLRQIAERLPERDQRGPTIKRSRRPWRWAQAAPTEANTVGSASHSCRRPTRLRSRSTSGRRVDQNMRRRPPNRATRACPIVGRNWIVISLRQRHVGDRSGRFGGPVVPCHRRDFRACAWSTCTIVGTASILRSGRWV
jgi:hypothetical protein